MRASGGPRWGWLLGLAVLLGSCNAGDALLPVQEIDPGPITATALDMHSVQIHWTRIEGARTYELERRADLRGDFQRIATIRNQTSYVDRDLSPNTIYGYRLQAFNDLGQRIGESPVSGARTAPEPGIEVATQSVLGGDPAKSVDSTGYRVRVKGTSLDQTLPIDPSGTRIFQPLPPGVYAVSIDDIATQCELSGGSPAPSQVVTVTDQGLGTLAKARFDLSCRDRSKGRLRGRIVVSGDTVDANGYKLVLSGVASDTTLPASQRAVAITRQIGAGGGTVPFDNLFPGTYSLLVTDVGPLCIVGGVFQREGLTVAPLSDLSEQFNIACNKQDQGGARPFVFQTAWSRDVAAAGTTVVAAVTLDLRQDPARDVTAAQFIIRTPGATGVVRADSVILSAGWTGVINLGTPGQIQVVATNLSGPKGLVPVLAAHYTVIGGNGDRARTQTEVATLAGGAGEEFQTQVRAIEDTLLVGAGTGANLPPVAAANGPYLGTAGQPVSFTAAGSSDPDGSIASYAWNFGDGLSGTGQSPIHTYAAAGSYTATLTVTDNQGATTAGQAAVTIASAGGPPPTTPFTLKLEFGAFDPVRQIVPLDISLDLTADLPETPNLEQLTDWVLDSLVWNKDVLRFNSFERGSGTSTVNFIEALSRGVLRLRGTVASGQSTGIVRLGTVSFALAGTPGQTSAVSVFPGALTGTAANGSYNYKPRTQVQNASYTIASGPAPSTSVSGTVSSPTRGPLGGVTVSLGGGRSAITAGNGGYTIANVPAGSYSATVSGLPGGCTVPAAQQVAVAAAPVTGVNFSVTCTSPPPTGTVSGTIGFASGSTTPSLATVSVTIAPASGAPVVTSPSAGGSYAMAGIPVGSGTVTIANLPAGCTTAAATAPYAGLTAGATVTVAPFTVTCPGAPPANKYPLAVDWGPVTAGQATVSVKVDMNAFNDPANHGSAPDKIGTFQGTFGFPASRLSGAACTGQSGFTGIFNTQAATSVTAVLTNLAGSGGLVTIMTCTFTVAGTGPTTLTLTGLLVSDEFGNDFTSKIAVTVNPLP